ncbi:LAMI_0E08042g1_1 [Lachancea mirantina]|uniref:LAMI_0E08042g1_1 n=1 Tax=Lachancea mirantina TaxID=1230905 RepID=A0A1G4JMT1_9SACH|nr:LAMI_0E08042g1_1 [Lachancea mirantina]
MKVLGFNQDASCCSVATSSNALRIYNCDPFGQCFELQTQVNQDENNKLNLQDSTEPRFIIGMLFSTSLIAVADKNQGWQRNRKLRIINTKRNSTICELTFPEEIVDVTMNRKRLCVLLVNDQICIYDISCMKLLQSVDAGVKADVQSRRGSLHTTCNVKMALSSDDRSILCYSAGSGVQGEKSVTNRIVVFDALNACPINQLNDVHKGKIACIDVSHKGDLVATASQKGTIIRIFHTGVDSEFDVNNPLFGEFRRGTRPSKIYAIKFNKSSTLLGCVGDTDTLHIFKLASLDNLPSSNNSEEVESMLRSKVAKESAGQLGYFLSKSVIPHLPNHKLTRDYAFVKVDEAVHHCFGFPEELPNKVYIAGDDGKLQIYDLPVTPGSCTLVKVNKFVI